MSVCSAFYQFRKIPYEHEKISKDVLKSDTATKKQTDNGLVTNDPKEPVG